MIGAALQTDIRCPFCKQYGLVDDGNRYVCQCGFKLNKNICGHMITEDDIVDLQNYGLTKILRMTSKRDTQFLARLRLDRMTGKTEFDFHSYVPCPKCGQDMRLNNGGLFCDGCGIRIFRKQFGRELGDADLASLAVNKITDEMTFVSRTKGTSYNARLILNGDYTVSPQFVHDKERNQV